MIFPEECEDVYWIRNRTFSPIFLKCTSSNWLIKKNEKKIISTGIKDKTTIPQAITENILWYEVKVMLESNYTDLSLWFVNEWTFFFFTNFLCFCGALSRSVSLPVSVMSISIWKTASRTCFRWMNKLLKKNTLERIIELENQWIYTIFILK